MVALLALLALTVGETDDAFANAYSAAVSLQNLFPELPIRLLVTVTTSIGVLGALTIELTSYQSFLLLLGSVFVPLFGVLLGHWLVSGRRYDEEDVFDAPGWRPGLIAAWGVGFGALPVAVPDRPVRMGRAGGAVRSPEWGIGATVPSFVVSFALAAAIAAVQRRFSPRRLHSPRRGSRAAHDERRVVTHARRRSLPLHSSTSAAIANRPIAGRGWSTVVSDRWCSAARNVLS